MFWLFAILAGPAIILLLAAKRQNK
ncbi:MAG: photosystem II reaction center protein Ycf12 [Ruminococcaceae bacterium]|nr:photosystem II reaction center protein Ycf12 [Oscillospiraceae bacterium]